MTRIQVQQAVVVLLLAAFIGTWALTRKIPLKKSPAPPHPLEQATAIQTPFPERSKQPDRPPQVERNPFALPPLLAQILHQRELERLRLEDGSAEGELPQQLSIQLPSLTLQGVFWGITAPQAIINRRILSIGDELEGAKLVAVQKDAVTVSYQGQNFTLKLPEPRFGKAQRIR